MTRKFLVLPLFLLLSLSGFAQTIKGRITDGQTGEALPYVNIGVVGKALGTVSTEKGEFELAFPEKLANDTVRVSALGYATLNLTLRQLSQRPALALMPAPVALAEVRVQGKSVFRRTRTLGFTSNSENATLTINSRERGAQIGTIISLKRKPTRVLNANFNVAFNRIGELTFRINLYRLDAKGQPTDQKLLPADIITSTDIQKGPISVDLTKASLVLEEDFFLSIEWIGGGNAAEVKNGLAFSAGLGYANNDIYYRTVSQAAWERISAGAVLAGMQPKLGFYVTVQD